MLIGKRMATRLAQIDRILICAAVAGHLNIIQTDVQFEGTVECNPPQGRFVPRRSQLFSTAGFGTPMRVKLSALIGLRGLQDTVVNPIIN